MTSKAEPQLTGAGVFESKIQNPKSKIERPIRSYKTPNHFCETPNRFFQIPHQSSQFSALISQLSYIVLPRCRPIYRRLSAFSFSGSPRSSSPAPFSIQAGKTHFPVVLRIKIAPLAFLSFVNKKFTGIFDADAIKRVMYEKKIDVMRGMKKIDDRAEPQIEFHRSKNRTLDTGSKCYSKSRT
jgi:hypothetical protein